jgi:cyanophycinase
MNGLIALVGSGEFTAAMVDVDRGLLAATGRDKPRVAIVPAASWPDGERVYNRWMAQGEEHFAALGAEPLPIRLRDLTTANDSASLAGIDEADLVYFSGGKPGYLLSLLRDTAAGAALDRARARGAVLAGCSAGAMVLGSHQLSMGGLRATKTPVFWQKSLGFVPGIVVVPHYDAIPEALLMPLILAAPRGDLVVGIDEKTALVGRDGGWQVEGRGRVTIWRGSHRRRHRAGSDVSL